MACCFTLPGAVGSGIHRIRPVEAYRAFVAAGGNQPSPWKRLRNHIYLGSEAFVEKMQRKLDVAQDLSEVPSAQRRQMPKALTHYERKYPDRDEAIAQAYASGGYGLKNR